jgi:uncharacterized Zn finger protein (UPF0148 family)
VPELICRSCEKRKSVVEWIEEREEEDAEEREKRSFVRLFQ